VKTRLLAVTLSLLICTPANASPAVIESADGNAEWVYPSPQSFCRALRMLSDGKPNWAERVDALPGVITVPDGARVDVIGASIPSGCSRLADLVKIRVRSTGHAGYVLPGHLNPMPP
jgi:hypothetical protein